MSQLWPREPHRLHQLPLMVNGQPISFGAATSELSRRFDELQRGRAAGALKLDTTDQGVPTVRNMVLAMDGKTIDGRGQHRREATQRQGRRENISTGR